MKPQNGMILLVEDNEDDEMLTLRALKKAKIVNEVTVVRDGAEALDYLHCTGKYSSRDIQDTPALVLLDLKLPKISGHEVLKRMRHVETTVTVPVVVLTTSVQDEDIVASYKCGANSYVRKPVEFAAFAEAVRQLSVYWLILNEGVPRP